jgi:hypothetical protein
VISGIPQILASWNCHANNILKYIEVLVSPRYSRDLISSWFIARCSWRGLNFHLSSSRLRSWSFLELILIDGLVINK